IRQAFVNPATGLPALGLGDARDLAAALYAYDPTKYGFLQDYGDRPYGILLAEGEIFAWQAVRRDALVDRSILDRHVERRALRGDNIKERDIGIWELSEELQVPNPASLTVKRYEAQLPAAPSHQ